MIIVFCIVLVFIVIVTVFMFHELFVVKKNHEKRELIQITISRWDDDLLENFIRHTMKFNKYIDIKINVTTKEDNERFLHLLHEKYNVNIVD